MRRSKYTVLILLLFFGSVLSLGTAAVSFIDSATVEVSAAYDRGFEAGVDFVQVVVDDDTAKQSHVPLYLQTDPQWASESYSTGTIESHGCGLVSAAIATTYLTGQRVTPDLLSKYAGDAFLSGELNDSDLICRWLSEHYDIKMLDEGYMVLAAMGGQLGEENYGGHIVLLYEHTDDDCFYIRDPFSGNNSVRKFSRQEIEQVDWGSFNGLC